MSREHTKRLYELIEAGIVSQETVIDMCMDALSDSEVGNMLDMNELSERFDGENGLDDEPDVDEAQEWADFDPEC